jgi:hypothetical protein
MVDGLSKWAYRAPVGRRARVAPGEIASITFHDSVIAFKKQKRERPTTRIVGQPTL